MSGCVGSWRIVPLALVVRNGRVPFQRGLVDHGHYGHGHVGPHYVRVGHTKEQHERDDVTGADPCSGRQQVISDGRGAVVGGGRRSVAHLQLRGR